MNKKVFTVKDENGVELELAIKKPTAKVRIDSQLIHNKAWKEAVDAGSMLRRNIEREAEKLGLWNDDIRKEIESVADELRQLERKLRAGSTYLKSKEEAKATALKMKELRAQLLELNRSKDELYPYTAESHADDARLKYFVSQCCVDNNTGKPFFKSYEDYVAQSETEVAQAALSNYFELMFSDSSIEDIQATWYENSWLKDNGYVDSKFRLINSEGKLVDSEGRLISEDGRYVNELGEYVDRDGFRVDEDGNYVVEYVPFE